MGKVTFGIRFSNIKPNEIRLGELAKVLNHFEGLIVSYIQETRPQLTKEALGISLVSIVEGSTGLICDSILPEVAVPAYQEIAHLIGQQQFLHFKAQPLSHLIGIHDFLNRHTTPAEFLLKNGSIQIETVLLAETKIPNHPIMYSEQAVYGHVTWVGGKTPKVWIDLPNGKQLGCDVKNYDLVRKIGTRLYTWVGLRGIAKIDTGSLEIIKFEIKELLSYEDKPIDEAFKDLADLLGNRFDAIEDVDSYVSNLRQEVFA